MNKVEKKLRVIANEYGVKVYFKPYNGLYGGYYHGDKRTITVVRDKTVKNWVINAFFHELCHVLDHRDGLYMNYYKKGQSRLKRGKIALKAERHVDRRAEKLCFKHYPKVKYHHGYDTPEKVQFLRDFFS